MRSDNFWHAWFNLIWFDFYLSYDGPQIALIEQFISVGTRHTIRKRARNSVRWVGTLWKPYPFQVCFQQVFTNPCLRDLPVYNFQAPYKYDKTIETFQAINMQIAKTFWNFPWRDIQQKGQSGEDRQDRQHGQEKHDWHLNLTFQLIRTLV